MKIRYIIVIYTLSMLAVAIYVNRYFKNDSHTMINMEELNDKYKEVEFGLYNQTDIPTLEEQCQCQILMLENVDYEASYNQAIANGSIIMDYYENGMLTGKIIFEGLGVKYDRLRGNLKRNVTLMIAILTLLAYGLLFVIYIWFVKPFQKLRSFSGNIAKGNLDIPLKMYKHNYFGVFTESFDIMREELKKAKEGEYRANVSKKELVASLSHDVKTPVSTIKAICEILLVQVKEVASLDKIRVIHKKTEIINDLISNMFQATLEELEALTIEPKEEYSTIIPMMFEEINHYGKITFDNPLPHCLIYADKLRLNQVIDNVVNNAYKYADTDISVFYEEEEEGVSITIRDYGEGVKAEELPLVTEKYYRAGNVDGRSGSGLGLYLAKLFMEGMDGSLECYSEDGFIVVLSLKKV